MFRTLRADTQPMLRLVGLWQQFQQANMSVLRVLSGLQPHTPEGCENLFEATTACPSRVQRLGDIMNAPPEPYSVLPSRLREGRGEIVVEKLAFRYAEDRPYLYEDFNLHVAPGKIVAIMGPSGSGKSTLTKLLQGFYQPSNGIIKIRWLRKGRCAAAGTRRRTPCGCTDIRYMSANELRHYFGVVPQETVLFSGTIYENEPPAASFSAG